MTTVICTTDRPDSRSGRLTEVYRRQLEGLGEDALVLDLKTVPAKWISDSSYGKSIPDFDALLDRYIRSADRLVFVVPEYNGGFPGYLKFFIDACDHGDLSKKKTAMLGLASGRSGNLRGVDHLTGIMHYLGSEVYSKKVYISQVDKVLAANGELNDPVAVKEIHDQLTGFLRF